MHELKRRSYLQELGIDSYSSRSQLVGAARTRRLVIQRQPKTTLAPAEISSTASNVQSTPVESRSSIADIASSLSTGFKEAQAPSSNRELPAAAAKETPVQAFNVAAIVSGNWLWIEELTHGVLSRDQVHLVQAMTRALGATEPKSHSSQFDWPIHNNAQLDLGIEAARAGLAGFVQRKVEQYECQGLIVLGRACEQRLAIQQLRIQRCVRTVSTAEMLDNPQLKKQAWEAILPLISPS